MKIAHFADLKKQTEQFCSPEILAFIGSFKSAPNKKLEATDIRVHVYDFTGKRHDLVDACKEAVGIWRWLSEVTGLRKRRRRLSVAIWFTPFPKLYHGTGKIGYKEINSGEYDPKLHRVTIWRHQDWRYVLMHEYLHALRFDRNLPFPEDEAWVTASALWFHTMYRGGSWRKQYKHSETLARKILSLRPSMRGSGRWYIVMAFHMMHRDASRIPRRPLNAVKQLEPLVIRRWPLSLQLTYSQPSASSFPER